MNWQHDLSCRIGTVSEVGRARELAEPWNWHGEPGRQSKRIYLVNGVVKARESAPSGRSSKAANRYRQPSQQSEAVRQSASASRKAVNWPRGPLSYPHCHCSLSSWLWLAIYMVIVARIMSFLGLYFGLAGDGIWTGGVAGLKVILYGN